jgi:hypothetical protein
MHVYVCVHLCTRVSVLVRMCKCMHVPIWVCHWYIGMYVWMYKCMNVWMYEWMNEWTDGWMDEWMTPPPFQSFPGYIGWRNHSGSSGCRSSRTLHVYLSSHPRSFNFPRPVAACRPLLSAKLQAFLSPGSRRLKTNFGCRLRMNVAFPKTCLA